MIVSARHLVLSFAILGLLAGEAPAAARATRPLAAPFPVHISQTRWPADSTIHLCAIRVEFRRDTLPGTSGNGLMGDTTVFPSTLTLDPIPHDSAYFADHISFLKSYYETVSKGHVRFASPMPVFPTGADSAYRLDYPMWHYNHNNGEDDLNRTLVQLFVDAVNKADQDPALNHFQGYDAIVVFHAGTGRDFDLGFDATPFDIPSAYINEHDLATQPVPLAVLRGLILPEGENQQEALDLGIELSMNGIMVKLFGNWLGLPDLFNTQTGQSGIGRWGMMDQGSGNVDALVPAMPDAWSRVYMGWENPVIEVPSGLGDSLHIARFGDPDTVQVIKLPVTPQEYYLIENRSADEDSGYTEIPDTGKFVELLDRENHRLQVYRDGRMAVEPGFRVAVRVRDNQFDFGIPGSGILVWHINEDVIAANIESNTVNSDINHRGVDLVEADGAQDIGMDYGFASAGSGTELGVPEDAWYKNNIPHRDANRNALTVRFADETFPSAKLYDGSFPRFELNSFSEVGPVMGFVARSTITEPGFPVTLAHPADWTVADVNRDGRPELYFLSSDSLMRADSLGHLSTVGYLPSGMHLSRHRAIVPFPATTGDAVLLTGSQIGILRNVNGLDSLRFLDVHDSLAGNPYLSIYPARSDSNGAPRILLVRIFKTVDRLAILSFSLYDMNLNYVTGRVDTLHSDDVAMDPFNIEPFPAHHFVFASAGEAVCAGVEDSAISILWDKQDSRIRPQAVVVADPETTAVYLSGYGYVDALSGGDICLEPACQAPQVDWNGDGIPEGGGRFGSNTLLPEDKPHISALTLWTIDLDASGDPDLYGLAHPESLATSGTEYTRVYATSHNGSRFTGFPLAATVSGAVRPFLWTRDQSLHTMTVFKGNGGYCYSVVRLTNALSRPRFAYTDDNAIINIGPLNAQANSRANWVYCWPNPTSDVSRIRITVPYAAQAEVRIFDLAGRKVADLHGESSAPGPLAFEVPWDVANVESGVYVGRVIVHGNGASQESQIKIAVVK